MIDVRNSQNIFIDFDGVIKESVKVKSNIFKIIFLPFGKKITHFIKNHHEQNGGMSRYDKIPIYLSIAGEYPSKKKIKKYADMFSNLAIRKVINSKWVPGVKFFLKEQYNKSNLFLVSATPQSEIEEILYCLKINHFFQEIIGSPTKKKDAIAKIIHDKKLTKKTSLMIGDSFTDYEAAKANNIKFILRKTKFNIELQQKLYCHMIEDFINE